ncbi:troponin C, isotype gamma-like isoform X1 [Homarus americanus]|uniref:Troponin C isoform 4' n=1 Tax=Homarus americanus TaxID=6706 RepID=C6GBF4_HOMAM|nr:troponin C, isotype gamma-like isoform X1 [Homarus americanus]ACS36544.1 troponin C isoform 4' [Homarus americanus]
MNESIVGGLDKVQVEGLRKAFDAFDTDKKGAISTDTVSTILRMMGVKISEKNLQEVISEVDEDDSGELEFEEFCALAAKFLIEEDEESLKTELKEAFRIYDKQGDGYITTQTLKEILRELDNKLTEEDLDGIIDEVDEDGSGTLDFDEFMGMMAG